MVAATNRPNDIDPALRRPGRLDREIQFAPPGVEVLSLTSMPSPPAPCYACRWYAVVTSPTQNDRHAVVQERAAILQQNAKLLPLAPGTALDGIAADCVGYTGADLAALCRQAAMRALTSGLTSFVFDFESVGQLRYHAKRCLSRYNRSSEDEQSLRMFSF